MKKLILTIFMIIGLATIGQAAVVEFYSDRVVVNPDEAFGGWLYVIPGSSPSARIIVYEPDDVKFEMIRSQIKTYFLAGTPVPGTGANMAEFSGDQIIANRGDIDGTARGRVSCAKGFLNLSKNSCTITINAQTNERLADYHVRLKEYLDDTDLGFLFKEGSYSQYKITP